MTSGVTVCAKNSQIVVFLKFNSQNRIIKINQRSYVLFSQKIIIFVIITMTNLFEKNLVLNISGFSQIYIDQRFDLFYFIMIMSKMLLVK